MFGVLRYGLAFVASRVLARRPLSGSLSGDFSFVASLVSARRPTYLSLLRQRNVSQRKATRVCVSLRCAKGNLRCSRRAGSLQTRFAQTCNLLSPPAAALLGTRTRERNAETRYQDTRSGASGSPFLPSRWCKAPAAASGIPAPAPHPCGCAEQRSEARIKRDACLSPQGEFADSPRFASSAGCPGAQHRGRRHQGRLLFAHFLLAKQEKVSRPPGRDPACHDSNYIKK